MTRWLASGRRRDICVLVCHLDAPTGQSLKRALEEHYETTITPTAFYGAADALVERGFLRKQPDGVHDRYSLTAGGERALREHFEWMAGMLQQEHE